MRNSSVSGYQIWRKIPAVFIQLYMHLFVSLLTSYNVTEMDIEPTERYFKYRFINFKN